MHGIANGNVLVRHKLTRRYVLAFFEKREPCLVGMEACATSDHWSRVAQEDWRRYRQKEELT